MNLALIDRAALTFAALGKVLRFTATYGQPLLHKGSSRQLKKKVRGANG